MYFTSPRTQYIVQQGLQTSYDFESKNWHEFNGGLNLRLAVWKCARKVIEDNAIGGVGIGDAKDALMESYAHYKFEFAEIHRLNSHNNYLDFWIKAGLFGLCYFLAYLILPLIWSFKSRNYLAMAFLVLVGAYCLTENFFSVQKGVCFFSLFISLYLCLPKLNNIINEG
jgi:O-antigen ligase